jgi:hypothetical protein
MIRAGAACRALLKGLHPRNEIIFELYSPAGDRFFDLVQDSLPAWSVEMTLEAPDEALRRRNGKFACSNALVEATMQSALAHGCRRLDVFFMVGLPHQTYADALGIADYAEHLIERFGADTRLRTYVAPLAPFLDPGSRAFEHPDLGVSLFCRTLEDHRQACLQNGWPRVLSYETDAMTRAQIAAATYEVAGRLNAIKHAHGLLTWRVRCCRNADRGTQAGSISRTRDDVRRRRAEVAGPSGFPGWRRAAAQPGGGAGPRTRPHGCPPGRPLRHCDRPRPTLIHASRQLSAREGA